MRIAGIDISYGKDRAIGALLIYEYPQERHLRTIYESFNMKDLFKYQPGLLFLREGPIILRLIEKVRNEIDILLVNGHGIAHPFEFGLARFVELALNLPTVGFAKEPLIGKFEEPERKRGNYSYLVYEGKVVGIVVCTKDGCKPIVASSGGKLKLREIYELSLLTTKKYKFPLPLHKADKYSRSFFT